MRSSRHPNAKTSSSDLPSTPTSPTYTAFQPTPELSGRLQLREFHRRFALKVTLKIRKPFTGNVLVDAFPTPYESCIVSNAAPTRDSRILRLPNDALN